MLHRHLFIPHPKAPGCAGPAPTGSSQLRDLRRHCKPLGSPRSTRADEAHVSIIFLPWKRFIGRDHDRRVSNDTIQYRSSTSIQSWYIIGMAGGGTLFGAIHVAGWNLNFPTPIERILWHVASVVVMTSLPISLAPYLLLRIASVELAVWFRVNAVRPWGFLFGLIYSPARLFLFVESFRTVAFLPPSVYATTWVSNSPSFS
jgi:hypothetical protein